MKTQLPKYENNLTIRKSFDNSVKLQDFLKYYPKSDGTRRYYRLRYAKGEITKEEYNETKKNLEN